jgi:hypothetical protein
LRTLAESRNSRTHLADAYHALGAYQQRSGNHSQAEQLWQQAIFLAHESDKRRLLWRLHADLANISTNPALTDVHRRIAAEVIHQMAYPIEDEALRQKFLNAPFIKAITAVQD